MEIVPAAAAQPLTVVDYAHTPDALAKALAALREHCAGAAVVRVRLRRRPRPGEAADDGQDRRRARRPQHRHRRQSALRGSAVDHARDPRRLPAPRARRSSTTARWRSRPRCAALRTGDVVLIAGKGHEDYQVYGATRRPFSDRDEALRHLRARRMRTACSAMMQEVAASCGGRLHGENRAYGVVSTDTRALSRGALFVALRGPELRRRTLRRAGTPRRGGGRGRPAARRGRPAAGRGGRIRWPRCSALSRAWRRAVHAAAGRGRRQQRQDHGQGDDRTRSSRAAASAWRRAGNLNNRIGVPLTLLRLGSAHRSAVVELGANRVGDVAGLMRARAADGQR